MTSTSPPPEPNASSGAEKPSQNPGTSAADAWALLSDNNIDSRWIGETLAGSGGGDRIESIAPSLVGTGQVGENVRCTLRWLPNGDDADDGELPSSVVIKLASSNETSRAAAEATRTYIREVGFYRDVAPSVAIRVPKVHHVWENRAANRFILVMEDISPAEAGDQLAGCTMDRAELAVDAAADLHGSTWGRVELADLDWLEEPTAERIEERVGLWHMLYPGFVERYRARLSDEAAELGSWLDEHFRAWTLQRADLPKCLIHGDFRLDNMLFGTGDPAPAITTVDWQTPALGSAMSDVAYFLSGSLERDELRAAEPALLSRYRERLAANGAELSETDCLNDYRLASPGGFVMAVIASQLVGQTDRGDDMFMVMADGSAAQSLDLDTAALVS